MKIAILTLSLHTNYGGILQAYALQTILQRMGHDVVVLDEPAIQTINKCKAPFLYVKRLIWKCFLRKNAIVFREQYYNRLNSIARQFTQLFINKYINRIDVDNLSKLSKNSFDAIVVGSDQVWRPLYFHRGIKNAYLYFARSWNIKRIAYAPSFGTEEWEYTKKQTADCAVLLRKFDAVSVREESGAKLCHKYLGIYPQVVLDPTMLLDIRDYIQIIKDSCVPRSEGTLFYYILDDTKEKQELINKIARDKNMIPFQVNSKVEDYNAALSDRIHPPVEQWLRGFYDAEFVITDSFHACVFSILFNKPFIVYGNKDRGMARFLSLLKRFGLEELLMTNIAEYNEKKNKEINYEKVNQTLLTLKKESYFYLTNSLLK